MIIFAKKLLRNPPLGAGLIAASFFISILGLASTVYMIQVLSRYIGFGMGSTLITLAVGTALAIAFEFSLRHLRLKLLEDEFQQFDCHSSNEAYNALLYGNGEYLERISKEGRSDILQSLSDLHKAHNAANFASLLDLPFGIIFVIALYFLSPLISLIAVIFIGLIFTLTFVFSHEHDKTQKKLSDSSGNGIALMNGALDTQSVRAFNAQDFLKQRWTKFQSAQSKWRARLSWLQGSQQNINRTLQLGMSVAIVGTGAWLVVNGELAIGAMIGANILAARAMQPISHFASFRALMINAKSAEEKLKLITKLPRHPARSLIIKDYTGRITFEDVSFSYPNATTPLFENVNIDIAPGQTVAVVGSNATGKSTFAKMICGLLAPTRGKVLLDKTESRQISQEWWHQQLLYLPQEPSFFHATLKENLTILNPEISDEHLNMLIEQADLNVFIDSHKEGINMMLPSRGENLPIGIRRRMALVRAMTTNSQVGVFDEPLAGLDKSGKEAFNNVMNMMIRNGRTLFVFTHDADLIKGAQIIIDLNSKPTPDIRVNQS